MSDYDLFGDYEPERPATLEEERPRPKPKKRRRKAPPSKLSIVLAVLVSVGVVSAVGLGVLVNQNPALSPFGPTPAASPTLFVLGGPTGDIVSTRTPVPTATRIVTGSAPTASPAILGSPTGVTAQPAATLTVSVLPFTLQNEAVTYTKNLNGKGCGWQSIAGQIFDMKNKPLVGFPIQVTGQNFEQIVYTGTASLFGPSGYEVYLNSTPVEAQYVVQLLYTTGQPLSEPVVVHTLSACDQNVAIINFIQNHEFTR